MVNKKEGLLKRRRRTRRYFSEEVRREVVMKIERNQLGISQASREYEVSTTSIYNWMNRYSVHLKKGNILVVEKKSRTQKVEQLNRRLAEMERIIGQKQLEIDILSKALELGSEHVGFDIKKKFIGRLSSGSASTGEVTPTN